MTLFEYNLGNYGKYWCLCASLLLICLGIAAQKDNVIRIQPCSDSLITHEVDSLKNFYSKNGFSLLKEATITMQSEFELPVIVPLTEGSWYQFIFIGDYTSQLYEVRMYDWDEKMVVYQKKQWGDIDGNIISYSYHAYQAELFPTSIRARAVGFVYSWSRLSAMFSAFVIAGCLREFGVNGVFAFISSAMVIVMLAIGTLGPKTRDVALEDISK